MSGLYVTEDQVAEYIGKSTATQADRLAWATRAGCRYVDSKCGRRFDGDTVATERVFFREDCYSVRIDDAHEITAVAVDSAGTGTYATTVDDTAYLTYPLNGIGPNGRSGWPIRRLVAYNDFTWPATWPYQRPSVQVEAKWGWAAVPDDVIQASLLLAARIYKLQELPLGSIDNEVVGAIPVRQLTDVDRLLSDYMTTRAAGSRFLVA